MVDTLARLGAPGHPTPAGVSETFGSGTLLPGRGARASGPVPTSREGVVEGFLVALAISFGVIFVAELGDKSQLMAMAFAARFRPGTVLAAISVATALVHLVSVGVGHVVGAALPTAWIAAAAGAAFLGFAAWTLRGDRLSEADVAGAGGGGSALLAVGGAFFLAELGDKTMLATVTLATQHGWVGTWVGSTAGMVAADAMAILAGRWLGRRLPEKTVRYGAVALFVVFGLWLLADGVGQLG